MIPRAAHVRVLARLSRSGVDYLLMGVFAVNHYARDPSQAYFIFRSDGVPVCCASLADLLAAKERAGRPKDRAFLKLYAAAMPGAARSTRRARRRPGRA